MTNDLHMEPCFDEELLDTLTPDEVIYVSMLIASQVKNDPILELDFFESTAYEKLYIFFSEEMPYGIAKARTGDPDTWIINKLVERYK